jgi:CelD/BcsL family acetyltransferase involved in cellulose biosynthesis
MVSLAGFPNPAANHPGRAQGLGRGLSFAARIQFLRLDPFDSGLLREMKNLASQQPTDEIASDNPPRLSLRLHEVKNTSAGDGLRCEIVSDFSGLEKISSDWERLWQADPRAEIFQTFAWARAWWPSCGDGFAICSPVVFEGNKIVGILPLVKRGNILQFLGVPEADYADMLCEEGREAEVLTAALGALFKSGKQWDECILEHLAKEGRILRHVHELAGELRRHLRLVPGEGYQTILLHENREQIFNSLLGKHHTKRRQNKLKKAGELTLRRLVTESEVEQHLNYFCLHHTRRGALLGRESRCATQEYRQFLRAMFEQLDPNDRLRFEVLELDGHPFAWHFSFLVNGKFLLYQHTFDLDAWDYAPGEVLVSNLLRFAQDNVTREFDFGCGDEPYKRRFATHGRETFSLYVEPSSVQGRIRGWLRAAQGYFYPGVRHIKEKAKAHTSTFRVVRSIRIWTSGVLKRIRQSKENGTLVKYWSHRTAQVFRHIVWGKDELSVFPWEALVGPDGRPLTHPPCNAEVEVKSGRFGDLVDLATERPDLVVASELPEFRQRLKKGDQLYIGGKSARVVLLAWTSKSTADDMLTSKVSYAISPDKPALVMYDFWTEPGLSNGAAYGSLMAVLKMEAASKKLDLLIRSRADQVTLRTELEHQGFLPQYRIVRYRFFYWFRWTRVFHTKQAAANPSLVGAVGA